MSTLSTNWSARPLQPVLLPHERKALCGRRGHATPLPLGPHGPRGPSGVAVCFFGMLARLHKAGTGACRAYNEADPHCKEDFGLTQHLAVPSFQNRVIDANPNQKIDIFLHTWGTQYEAKLRKLYAPRAAAFGVSPLAGKKVAPATMWWGWPSGSAPGMFASIEVVLSLKRAAEREDGKEYKWVLLARPDLFWLADFRFASLNSSLLYLANYCQDADRAPAPARCTEGAAETDCREVRMRPFGTTAPDYYFAGASSLIDTIFSNLTWEIERYCFTASRMYTGNHKVIHGRLDSLGIWGSVGRYLVHEHDLVTLRDSFLYRRLPCLRAQSARSNASISEVDENQHRFGAYNPAMATRWRAPSGGRDATGEMMHTGAHISTASGTRMHCGLRRCACEC